MLLRDGKIFGAAFWSVLWFYAFSSDFPWNLHSCGAENGAKLLSFYSRARCPTIWFVSSSVCPSVLSSVHFVGSTRLLACWAYLISQSCFRSEDFHYSYIPLLYSRALIQSFIDWLSHYSYFAFNHSFILSFTHSYIHSPSAYTRTRSYFSLLIFLVAESGLLHQKF